MFFPSRQARKYTGTTRLTATVGLSCYLSLNAVGTLETGEPASSNQRTYGWLDEI
jgi:hypothetical protein